MSDVLDAPRPRTDGGEAKLCDCGSGLPMARCCGLDLARTPRTPPEGVFAERVGRMSRAYNDGEGKLAEHLALEILNEAPGQRDALGALYNVCKDEGRVVAAGTLARRLAGLYPNDPISQMTAAQFFINQGQWALARPHARMVVRLAPEAASAHIIMGQVFNGLNRTKAAEHHFRWARTLVDELTPEIEGGLGVALRDQGLFDEARAIFARLAEAGPNLEALLAWAQLEEADRQFDIAADLLDRAALLAPDGPRIALGRAKLDRRAKRFEQALEALQGLDERLAAVGVAGTGLLERGQLLDALGRHDEAFEAFTAYKRGVAAQPGQAYDAVEAEALVGRLKDFFTEGRSRLLPRAGVRTDVSQPIFVVGFPRSGTTLVEQTLSAHPNIAGGDELSIIHQIIGQMQPFLGSPGVYPVALSELWLGDSAGLIDTLRDYYLNEALRLGAARPDRAWFTDKMPLNETHLGLISLLFPRSPVIHLVRHPLDVVLSVFSNGLSHGFNCASSLETAARHYALIADLIQHYLAVMPIHYRAVRYEDMVTDQQAQVGGLLEFIGEPFDPRTLDFHENRRPARTASYAQVTEKLYDRSLYRYRNYRRHLEPVIPILEPAIRRLGYDIED
ncbi:MAG: sulfotransferase [Caulobacteraceae bacterium]|nr:sulfotransferase [Caulobacteraceae bacterium]